jgi:hypothetical protein
MPYAVIDRHVHTDPLPAGAAESAPRAAAALPILAGARQRGVLSQSGYAGSVTPDEAWLLFSQGDARLIDVRSAEELKFVGRVPGSLHVAWMNVNGISLSRKASPSLTSVVLHAVRYL